MPGTTTSEAEVTHVSKHGFWLLLDAEELLVPFEHFPWFKKATIEQLSEVQWPTPYHLYWPQLDIDLSVESIRNPSAFPLVSKAVSLSGNKAERAESRAVNRRANSCIIAYMRIVRAPLNMQRL